MSPLPPFDPAFLIPGGDRAALRIVLRHHWAACRDRTLALFDTITAAQFCPQLHGDYSPLGWHLGHLGWTEELWILQQCAGEKPLDPTLNRLFAADSLPKAERQQLPDRGWILDYLAEVRSRVFAYLDRAPVDQQARLWVWLLQHESQHNETVAFLHRLATGLPTLPATALPSPDFDSVIIPAGTVVVGCDRIHAQDNERPAQRVWVDGFECDRFPVTQGQYHEFIAADGYQNPDHWSAAGWQWRTTHAITQPLHWQPDPAGQHHPVCGISYYEAEAYAHFVGKRLPTEWEWEKAAGSNGSRATLWPYPWGEDPPQPHHGNFDTQIGHTTAVNAYPQGQSKTGCWDLLGNAWEWTATPFAPYPGFEAYPYRGYSAAYFDGQHQVMRGGSWATRPWGLRNSFRNWYQPWVREIFVGVRLVRSL